jgi:DNA-binding beta-propeller fold protein YncE
MRACGWLWLWLLAFTACDGGGGGQPDAGESDGPPAVCMHARPDLAVATLAGCASEGDADGPRTAARFSNPTNVAIGPDGTVYVTDFDNGRVRAIDLDGTTRTVVFGQTFTHPFGIVFGTDGMLYVETDDNDRGGHSIETGTIWRVDTTKVNGNAEVVARDLGRPRGLLALADGRLVLADHMHHVLSILDPDTGVVAPLAGTRDVPGYLNATGNAALFHQPYDVVQLPDGDLLISELENHRLRRVTLAGVASDFAGTGVAGNLDGPLAVATFDGPQGLALGPDGAIYVTDIRKHYIRRIKDGMVKTIAGDGTRGFLDSDEPRGARFYGLEGIDVDATRLVIADGNIGDGNAFHRVRVIALSAL